MCILTTSGIQSSTTPFTLKVLRLLVINKHFLVIEIALAIVAPWPAENLFDIGMTALLFAHSVEKLAGNG